MNAIGTQLHDPKVSTRFSLSMEMSRLTRDGTAEPVSRDQILGHVLGQGNTHFPCSADHEHDWQTYPVDPHSAICDTIHTYILYTYILLIVQWMCPIQYNTVHMKYSIGGWFLLRTDR